MKDSDIDDVPFVACALGCQGSIIWSDDNDLKRQNRIKVYTTREVLGILKMTKSD
jgi:predicted nucleic acid-binding protein